MAGTFALRDLANQAAQAGAKLLLVGDPCQLSAIETGGAFGLLANSRPDTATLTKVRRFIDPDGTTRAWEQHATLALRRGDPTIFDTYQRHGRITAGDTDTVIESAYQAWRNDTSQRPAQRAHRPRPRHRRPAQPASTTRPDRRRNRRRHPHHPARRRQPRRTRRHHRHPRNRPLPRRRHRPQRASDATDATPTDTSATDNAGASSVSTPTAR